MQENLSPLTKLCCGMGLVDSDEKTKYEVRDREGDLFSNGLRLEKVSLYKYLEIHIGCI